MSERVENYRKRRGRPQPQADPAENFELEFEGREATGPVFSLDDALDNPRGEDSSFDMEIEGPVSETAEDAAPPRPTAVEPASNGLIPFEPAEEEPVEMTLGDPPNRDAPMEIVVGLPAESKPVELAVSEDIYVAPLGRRFAAGMADALMLILGVALFGFIIYRFCGRISPVPLNLAVLGLGVLILVFGYFVMFTALATATPGLIWMGCEVRNLRGEYPSLKESGWRAFGILVSMSALMLGFIWAWLDSDELTWHDRMSGTIATLRPAGKGHSKPRP